MKNIFKNKIAIFVFIFPTLLIYTVVVFYPIVQTLVKSLYNWDGINLGKFVGLKHYIKLFTRDSTFRVSIINGIIYPTITVLYQIGLGTVIALVLS